MEASRKLRAVSRRPLIAIVALLVLGASAAVAAAAFRETVVANFAGQRTPGASAGVRLDIEYFDPDNPNGKAPAVQKVVQQFPAGTKSDTSVPERCTASDLELMTQGASACPAGSNVGGGKVDLDTGIGPNHVLHFDVTLLNAKDQLILLLESTDNPGQRAVARATIEGTKVTTENPPIPGGPPDFFTAVKSVHLKVKSVTKGGRNYITTPPNCPASGSWTSSVTFTYRDGKTETRTSQSPCNKAGGDDRAKPKVSIEGVPRACVKHSFTVHIQTSDRSSLSSEVVKLDGQVLKRTTRKSIDVTVPAGKLGAGRHRISVAATDSAGNRGTRSAGFDRCGSDDDEEDDD